MLGSVGKCSWDAPTNSCVEVSALSPDQLELHCATGELYNTVTPQDANKVYTGCV